MDHRHAATIILALMACLYAPASGGGRLCAQEKVTLRDGTVITGRLTRMSGDTLFFHTSFLDELPVGRSQILSIEFEAGIDTGTPEPIGGATGLGKLMLIITGPELTTSIRFRRGDDRQAAAAANRIFFRITANEKVVYEKVDDEIDEEVRSEGWTILKNDFPFGRYEVSLPAGEYRVTVFVGNDLSDDYRRQFSSGSVSVSKTKEGVRIYRDGVTTLVMKSSQPFLSLGKYDLKWVE
jgi:hypothetical protein